MKDPRLKLIFWGRLSLIIILLIPILYSSVKLQNWSNLILPSAIIIIVFILAKKYWRISEGDIYAGTTFIGFMFSGLWFFIAIIFSKGIILEAVANNASLPVLFLFILLSFSFILLYLSKKSLKYEEKELKIKRRYNPSLIFFLYVIISLIYLLFEIGAYL